MENWIETPTPTPQLTLLPGLILTTELLIMSNPYSRFYSEWQLYLVSLEDLLENGLLICQLQVASKRQCMAEGWMSSEDADSANQKQKKHEANETLIENGAYQQQKKGTPNQTQLFKRTTLHHHSALAPQEVRTSQRWNYRQQIHVFSE